MVRRARWHRRAHAPGRRPGRERVRPLDRARHGGLGDRSPGAWRRGLAGCPGPGSQRVRQGRLGRAVSTVRHAPLRVHAVRDRGAARPAPASPTARRSRRPSRRRMCSARPRSPARIAAAADARPTRAQIGRRPERRTASIQARSRPIVVSRPCPGNTWTRSSRSASRPSDAAITSSSPPGRSVRPQPPANSVSPLNSRPSSADRRQTDPGVWPGRVEHLQADLAETDLAALRQLDGRHRGHDLERRRDHRARRLEVVAIGGVDRDLRTGVLGHGRVVPDVVPVAMGADDELEGPAALLEGAGDPGERRRRGVDGDGLARRRVREHVDVRRDGPDDGVDPLHGPSVARARRTDGPMASAGLDLL